MYYAQDVKTLLELERKKAREAAFKRPKEKRYDENGDEIPQDDVEADQPPLIPPPEATVKHSIHSGPYAICRKAGIGRGIIFKPGFSVFKMPSIPNGMAIGI